MKIIFLIFSLFVVIMVTALGCIESKKLPASNETKTATPEPTPSITEQGYFAWLREEEGMRLEGTLFPGLNKIPMTITSADFNENFIIAAMMGIKAVAEGPEIEIKNISRINDVINVTVRMYDPRGGAAVVSAPYHIIIVKRELLPKGNSTFVFIDTEGKELEKLYVKV
jgi:hypothetical protein